MRKAACIFLLVVISGTCSAQLIASKFRVNFTDKDSSSYSLSNPSAYLSQKAIDRRTAQGIAYDLTDLPVNPWYIDAVRNTGVTILHPSKWFNCVTIYTTDSAKISQIKAFSFVASIDSLAETSAKKGPRRIKREFDSLIDGAQSVGADAADAARYSFLNERSILSANTFDYGSADTQVQMVGTDVLHDLGYRGEGMTIAVLDAGFYGVNTIGVFDSLMINNQILGTKDFVDMSGTGNVYSAGTHGMSVLSIMGGNKPGELIGTAPKANYWLLKTEDGASEYPIEEDNWASGAEFADSVGADIINSSLGYTGYDNPQWSHTYASMDGRTARSSQAALMAARKGILVVNSAGNSGAQPWYYIGAPADADSMLAVGAVKANQQIAAFSSRGPSFDGRIKPDVCAMGEQTSVSNAMGVVIQGNGTSFSAPVISGSAACLWQAHPQLTNIELLQIIRLSADRAMNPDMIYGYGIPDMALANLILSGEKIHNFDTENTMNVAPNPFRDDFNVFFYSADSGEIIIELFDMSGKSVYKSGKIYKYPGYTRIPVTGMQNLQQGMYILKAYSNMRAFTGKILKAE